MRSHFDVSPQVSSDAIGQRETLDPLGKAWSRLAFPVLRLAHLVIKYGKLAATPWTSICLGFDQVRSGKHGLPAVIDYSF